MATTVDPRMISVFKPLVLDDARFEYLSAYQSQITFLESINLQTVTLNVTNNLTLGGTLFTNQIVNTTNIDSAGGTFDVITTNSLFNNSNIATNDLVASNNTTLGNLAVTGNVVTEFAVATTSTNYTFSDADKSKVIHFDTSTTPEISAIFPNTLSDGFNAALVNAGSGVIYLSGESGINAQGISNSLIYTGIFVYKVNGNLFGVGSFE